jgi:CubicO group peptidase (beta-lactamase class C family)
MTKFIPRGRLAEALQLFVDKRWIAGAVMLVADKDKVLSLETVGYADLAAGKPMRPDTLFWVASQSKPITAVAFMMLVDEGKVSLDDPVEKYLPEFKGQWLRVEQDADHALLRKPRHPITVRNILSHTGGLAFSSPVETPTLDRLTLRQAAASYAMMPLEFEPDTQYQYSNAGINTAGRIIEVLSGMPYEEFLDRRLLKPLGMKDTTFWPNKRQLARLTKAYKPNAAGTDLEETPIPQLHYPLDDRARQPIPAGGLFSTARDCCRFCQMMINGGTFKGTRYLSESAVREMTRRQTAEGLSESYGLGWIVGDVWFRHGGAMSTIMIVDVQLGLIRVYLVQHAGYLGDGVQGVTVFNELVEREYAG